MKSPQLGLVELVIAGTLVASLPEQQMQRDSWRTRNAVTQICSGSQRPYERVLTPHAWAANRWTQVARDCRARTRRVVG